MEQDEIQSPRLYYLKHEFKISDQIENRNNAAMPPNFSSCSPAGW